MSKSTGPTKSRTSANNPGRGAGTGKTTAGRPQPPRSAGKPERLGANRGGRSGRRMDSDGDYDGD